MLKKFFTVFLGSLAAIWLSALIFIGIVIIGVLSWLGSTKSIGVKSDSILYIDLAGEMTDREVPFSPEDFLLGGSSDNLSFNEVSEAITLAKTDSDIKGIYLRLKSGEAGLAMRQELREILLEFKSSGKWIVAYADACQQGDYFTGAVSDEFYLNPSGSLWSNGLSTSVPFFKNALDKLGVSVQVIKVGTFKSAVEPFIMTQMSDSARMQYDVMLNSMWNEYVTDVVKDRKLATDSTSMFKRMAATPMMSYTAPELVDAKLFDGLKYEYEVEDILKSKAGSDKELHLITPKEYLAACAAPAASLVKANKSHIAVLYAVGDIVESGSDGIVGDEMAPLIISMADNDKIKGLVLRINSGGGSAYASEQIWASLEYFKSKDKPFVVSMGNVAASGGYYIACGADRIYADPSTITGSIGIFGVIPYAKTLLNDKLGIDFSIVETNPNAAFPRLDAPLTADQHAAFEKSIRNGYDLFVNRVSTGRKLDEAHVRRIAEGRVWAGVTALQIGLVDDLGGLSDAIAKVATLTDLSSDDYVEYPAIKHSPLDMLMSLELESRAPLSANAVLEQLGLSREDMLSARKVVTRLRDMGNIQAKMEDISVH
ncbi:MAG: signal peptide peptidase SppA [Muribaculaceae bacterium]|nr:signal peptide peptidase SppA [Muribaculaceae bacterium]